MILMEGNEFAGGIGFRLIFKMSDVAVDIHDY